MKEGLLKDAYELIIKEVQTIITILYLLMIGIGMLYNYKKYSLFDINIFEYADIFDFLIAPFADIRIILASIFALLITLLLFWFDSFFRKKFLKTYLVLNFGLSNKKWYANLRLVMFGLFLIYSFNEAASG